MMLRSSASRKTFVGGVCATAGVFSIGRGRARAAQFEYKLAHGLSTENSIHLRTVQMWDAVKAETDGRLVVSTFPANQLAAQNQIVPQLRLNAVQFIIYAGSAFSGVVPIVEIDSVGFTFTSPEQAWRVMDGTLGEYVRKDFVAHGLVAMPKKFDQGMREVCASTKPLKTAADFAGLKMAVPIAKLSVDFFKTLGAAPSPIPSNEWYTSAQTHLIDGVDCPFGIVEDFKLYEVQKFQNVTNHMWLGQWLVANGQAWNALPADIQGVVLRNQAKYADLQRKDSLALQSSIIDRLRGHGMTITTTDMSGVRPKLTEYYQYWKNQFGAAPWGLLEAGVGKLA